MCVRVCVCVCTVPVYPPSFEKGTICKAVRGGFESQYGDWKFSPYKHTHIHTHTHTKLADFANFFRQIISMSVWWMKINIINKFLCKVWLSTIFLTDKNLSSSRMALSYTPTCSRWKTKFGEKGTWRKWVGHVGENLKILRILYTGSPLHHIPPSLSLSPPEVLEGICVCSNIKICPSA